jgi:hypothetical protein
MGLEKRPSDPVELVSIFDNSFILEFSEKQREEYMDTLDIAVLGNISQMEDKPVVFKALPLRVKYEHMAYSDYPDAWGIFQNHVIDVKYFDAVKLEWKHERIEDSCRDDIPPRVVQDIANQIAATANKSGENFFFTPPQGALLYARRVQTKSAARKMSKMSVDSADAQSKNTD